MRAPTAHALRMLCACSWRHVVAGGFNWLLGPSTEATWLSYAALALVTWPLAVGFTTSSPVSEAEGEACEGGALRFAAQVISSWTSDAADPALQGVRMCAVLCADVPTQGSPPFGMWGPRSRCHELWVYRVLQPAL